LLPSLTLICCLLVAPLAQAGPKGDPALRSGEDIVSFRDIAGAGLSAHSRFQAYGRFLERYPRSPLAEVALARCLQLEGDLNAVLGRLSSADRLYLTQRFRQHHDLLLSSPVEGPAISDAEQPVAAEANATEPGTPARPSTHDATR